MEQKLAEQIKRWHDQNKHDAIVEAIRQLPEANWGYDEVCLLARAHNNLEQYGEAVSLLLRVEREGALDPLWHFRLGYAYYYLDRNREAALVFERTLELDPDDQHASMFLGWAREALPSDEEPSAAAGEESRGGNGAGRESAVVSASPVLEEVEMDDFWDDSEYALEEYVSEPPTDEMIASIEKELGYKLPASYIAMMKRHNGGIPLRTCFPMDEPTSWSEDHVAITGILGIGRDKDYALGGGLGSRFMIEEWGYPDIGVVLCDCPSAGHDVVMLDYRSCGPEGEPSVIHVCQESNYKITPMAPNFAAFIRGLVDESVYDTSEETKQDDLNTVNLAAFSPLLAELCETVAGEVPNMEAIIRSVSRDIVEEKGHFSLHADDRSLLLYDIQHWLYTRSYPDTTREAYLEAYPEIIVFAKGFSTGGYAPGFITDWLDRRLQEGRLEMADGFVRLTNDADRSLIDLLLGMETKPAEPTRAQQDQRNLQAEQSDQELSERIAPFLLVRHPGGNVSLILNVGGYKDDIFLERQEEGFEGNGYDWQSLARVFLQERLPELASIIRFDSEAGMFCAYTNQPEALYRFAEGLKRLCEDEAAMRDTLSRAELD